MTKLIRIMLVAALAFGGLATARAASADGDAEAEATVDQSGTSTSGDAVAGQVVGIVSSGDASVDARNTSEDVDVETGDTSAINDTTLSVFASGNAGTNGSDADGEATLDVTQVANAASGDGVGGQVIGVVTSAGGSADVVAENTSRDVDVETGDADAENIATALVSANASALGSTGADADAESDASLDQAADASSGDGVGGQVIGVVSAGDASVDARNLSEDVDVETGDADARNQVNVTSFASAFASDGGDSDAEAAIESSQAADASTGDGVGGQVIGVVTSAGGSADVVADNTSRDVDVETGDADAENIATAIATSWASSTTNGDADSSVEIGLDQAADASSGDGVGGQVIGVVSAGDASIDAKNLSEDVDVETGDADAFNEADISAYATAHASLNGDADAEATVDVGQTADASSGDAVAGQVLGVVTSAGGSADAVLDSTSRDSDAESGDSDFTNDEFIAVTAFATDGDS